MLGLPNTSRLVGTCVRLVGGWGICESDVELWSYHYLGVAFRGGWLRMWVCHPVVGD